jgi:chromate transporter
VGLREAFGDLRFSAPLTEITAAIVGAILNLALYFGYHVLWTQGLAGSFDWPSLALAVAAAIALFRCKVNVIYVIAACAIAGLLLRWFAPG